LKRIHYRFAAATVAFIHFGFITFVLFGAFAVLRWPQLIWLHVPAAAWGVLIELAGWVCPLTAAENLLLRRAGGEGYQDGFVAHYIFPFIYPDGMTRGVEIAIGAGVLVLNVVLYVRVFR
jgi:hypothetical protein